jgi:hypothetical protein
LSDVVVRETTLPLGLVDVKVCAIDDIWSRTEIFHLQTTARRVAAARGRRDRRIDTPWCGRDRTARQRQCAIPGRDGGFQLAFRAERIFGVLGRRICWRAGRRRLGQQHRCDLYLVVFLPSDIRLKRDVALVARRSDGLGLYRFRYWWSDSIHIGVMAREVALLYPEAVVHDPL